MLALAAQTSLDLMSEAKTHTALYTTVCACPLPTLLVFVEPLLCPGRCGAVWDSSRPPVLVRVRETLQNVYRMHPHTRLTAGASCHRCRLGWQGNLEQNIGGGSRSPRATCALTLPTNLTCSWSCKPCPEHPDPSGLCDYEAEERCRRSSVQRSKRAERLCSHAPPLDDCHWAETGGREWVVICFGRTWGRRTGPSSNKCAFEQSDRTLIIPNLKGN